MKKKSALAALISLHVLSLGVVEHAYADTINLKSGDRLSGNILTKAGDTLTLETTYAGNVVILWSEVASIETSKPAKFMLKDRTVMDANATSAGEAGLTLKAGEVMSSQPIALADIDYINPPPEVTGEGLAVSGIANLGFTANRGNTDNDQLYYAAETIARSIKNRFTIGATGTQKEENGEETTRNNRGYIKYDHFITPKWFAYANADIEEDKFKDLNLRTSVGVGAGYQFFDAPERSFAMEGGVSYVGNDYDIAEDDNYAAGRWAMRYLQLLGVTQFFHNHEGLFPLESPSDDLIIRSQTGVRFPLITNLTATVQYNVNWQKTPPLGLDKTDTSFIVSVGYLW